MNAVIVDPTGWITITMAARLKGLQISTLLTRIEEDNIPTRKWGKNRMVRLIDIEEAIEKAEEDDATKTKQRRGQRLQDSGGQMAASPNGRRKAIHRPDMPDAL